MIGHVAAFISGIFVAPLVFLASVGAGRIVRLGKYAISEAQQLPQTPERVALIDELKMRVEKLEELISRARSD